MPAHRSALTMMRSIYLSVETTRFPLKPCYLHIVDQVHLLLIRQQQ